jgi:hypothetical protein
MLARRLLVLAAVLLALGAVAASLAPRDLRGPQTTTTRQTAPPAAAPSPTLGRDVTLTVDASAPRPPTVSARVGDHVRLTVRASQPDAVSIAALGQIQAVDAYSPAIFDFLPDVPGSFPVTLQQSGRRVATLRITPAA